MAGTPLNLILPSTNPWGHSECGRKERVQCSQKGDKMQNCRRRNIVYESRCELCQKDGKSSKNEEQTPKVVYVGETARSLHERAKEHLADRNNMADESHMGKHMGTMESWLVRQPSSLKSLGPSRMH